MPTFLKNLFGLMAISHQYTKIITYVNMFNGHVDIYDRI